MSTRRLRRSGIALVCALAPLALVTACGDDDDSVEEQGQAYCEAVDQLRTDLGSLGNLSTSSSKSDREDLADEIKDDVEDVRDAGKDLHSAQVEDLQNSFTAFQQAVDSISDDQSIQQSLRTLAVDIAQLGDMVRETASAGDCSTNTTTTSG
jgi:hypothetical protein